MVVLIESLKIYEMVGMKIVNFLINPFAVWETWKGGKTVEPGEIGEVILNQNNLGLIELLPPNIATAIREPKRKVTRKKLSGDEIFIINTGIFPQNKVGVCKVYHWGLRYTTGTEMGRWKFEWGSSQILFSGRRNSFLNGNTAIASYDLGDFEVLILWTSEPEKPLIFQDVEIKPKKVVETKSKEEEKEAFRSSLKSRRFLL